MAEPSQPVQAYVAVGSNIDPQGNILAALELLHSQARITGVSTFYRTEPLGSSGQDDFLNGVWGIVTALGPREVKFGVLRQIEDRLGRIRSQDKYGPRTIDLDLVLYGQAVVDEPDLRLPAPDITRPFVAIPLLELAPNLVLPDTHQRLSSLACSQRRNQGMTAAPDVTRALRDRLESLRRENKEVQNDE